MGKKRLFSERMIGMDYRVWKPEGEIRGIVQLVHGMAEHIDRYDRVARALNKQGYLAVGHNHRGHGKDARLLGYFADQKGWDAVVEDIRLVSEEIRKQYPGKKLFLLGHSMGSFAVREYALRYGKELDGLILSGTGWYGKPLCGMGRGIALLMPPKKPAPLVDKIAFSANNRLFQPPRTPFDWLSRDEEEVDHYIADPLCGFVFTGRAYADFFGGLMELTKLERLKQMPTGLPVLLLSGDQDPVGQMGEGVHTVAAQYKNAGLKEVQLKLYPGARHEIFNEINRDEVYADLTAWLNEWTKKDEVYEDL